MNIRTEPAIQGLATAEISRRETPSIRRFTDVALRFCLFEAVLLTLVSQATALAYWRYALGSAVDGGRLAIGSVLIGLGVAGLTALRGGYASALQAGPKFTWMGWLATTQVFGTMIAGLFLVKVAEEYSRGVFISQFCVALISITIARLAFQRHVRDRLAQHLIEAYRVMVIGDLVGDDGLKARVQRDGGHIVAVKDLVPSQSKPTEAIIKDIIADCRAKKIDQVFVRAARHSGDITDQVVDALAEAPVTIQILPFSESSLLSRPNYAGIGGTAAMVVHNQPLLPVEKFLKRSFDVVTALVATVALAPLFLLIALAIRLDSRGPVLFRQTRHGYDNRPIRVFKFRSMKVMEDGAAFRQASKDDPRITRVGKFIRKTNIDELPQILNVLRGEMSIVGPRPHPTALNDSFADRIKWFNRRHNIRPGITGWAQINGFRGETGTLQKMAGRVEHDLWYVDNWSFILDMKIILFTAFSPLAYRNAG